MKNEAVEIAKEYEELMNRVCKLFPNMLGGQNARKCIRGLLGSAERKNGWQILPIQRGYVSVDNMTFINTLLYICENGCKWRRLPKEYGSWHVIYKRFNWRVKAGIITKLFQELHVQGVVESAIPIRLLDSMIVPVHPDASGALKKRGTGNREI